MSRRRYISLVVFVSLLFSALFFYLKMGGFTKTDITVVSSREYLVAGKYFKGRIREKEFGKLFKYADTLISKNNLQDKAWVCGLFFNNPEKEKDTIEAFIGVVLKDTLATLPNGYSYKKIEPRKVVRASIKAHYLLVPNIYPEIEEYADKNKIQLTLPSIEIYPKEDEVIIEVPVK
jgi:effector-binding domain-containing protein